MRPKVIIIIASHIVGGPGRGLFQFLKQSYPEKMDYLLCNFDVKGYDDSFEFRTEAEKRSLNFKLLKQSFTLDPSVIKQVYDLVKQNKINIIQTHGYKGHIIGYVLSKVLNVKWVAMVHGWTYENTKVKLYNKLELFLLRYPDAVITVSPVLYKTVGDRRGSKRNTKLVLNAVDNQEIEGELGGAQIRKNYGLTDEDFVIGVFGRLSSEKGHKHLLNSFSHCIKSHPYLKLLIVGDGLELTNLKSQSSELGIEDRVIFCGHQSKMKDYYEAIDLYVLPSLTEGIPNVVLEAMSMELPVLATNVGGVYKIIEDGTNGYIVPAGDETTMTSKLCELLENKEQIKSVGKIARKSLYPRFSPEKRARKILEVYSEALNDVR